MEVTAPPSDKGSNIHESWEPSMEPVSILLSRTPGNSGTLNKRFCVEWTSGKQKDKRGRAAIEIHCVKSLNFREADVAFGGPSKGIL